MAEEPPDQPDASITKKNKRTCPKSPLTEAASAPSQPITEPAPFTFGTYESEENSKLLLADTSSAVEAISNASDLADKSASSMILHDHSHTGVDMTEFHLFPVLPEEIRLDIWDIAIKVPRIVVWGPQKVPVFLHVNKESRDVALTYYELVTVPGNIDQEYSFYINFKHDLLYRSGDQDRPVAFGIVRNRPRQFDISWLSSVKRYALSVDDAVEMTSKYKLITGDLEDPPSRPTPIHFTTYMRACFPNLEELVIIIDPDPIPAERSTLENLTEVSASKAFSSFDADSLLGRFRRTAVVLVEVSLALGLLNGTIRKLEVNFKKFVS